MPNTDQYFGNSIKEAINFRKKDLQVSFEDPTCDVLKYMHHHTGIDPFNPPRYMHPEQLENMVKQQLTNYLQNN